MERVISYFRDLHRIPERSGAEYDTANYICNALSAIGYSPKRIGETGVYADLYFGEDQSWLLLRADIDALPICENSCAAFPSERDGMMHACGHDAHMAMLLDAAAALYGKTCPHNIRFLFQPAEETTVGAREMIRLGGLPKNTAACFAMHVWPKVEEGALALAQMASSDVFEICVQGKSVHCAKFTEGADALMTAVEIGTAIRSIQGQFRDAVVFLGKLHSGEAHNVVAGHAILSGTVRTYSQEKRQEIKEQIAESVKQIAAAHGTVAELIWDEGIPPVDNDSTVAAKLSAMFEHRMATAEPTFAAEDFALYQEHVPGVLLWLGIGDVPLLHTENFFVPEHLLTMGVEAWQLIAEKKWEAIQL